MASGLPSTTTSVLHYDQLGRRHRDRTRHDSHHRADDQPWPLDYQIWDDGWTVATTDRKWTAQFEHTIVVTEDGADIPPCHDTENRRRTAGRRNHVRGR